MAFENPLPARSNHHHARRRRTDQVSNKTSRTQNTKNNRINLISWQPLQRRQKRKTRDPHKHHIIITDIFEDNPLRKTGDTQTTKPAWLLLSQYRLQQKKEEENRQHRRNVLLSQTSTGGRDHIKENRSPTQNKTNVQNGKGRIHYTRHYNKHGVSKILIRIPIHASYHLSWTTKR